MTKAKNTPAAAPEPKVEDAPAVAELKVVSNDFEIVDNTEAAAEVAAPPTGEEVVREGTPEGIRIVDYV